MKIARFVVLSAVIAIIASASSALAAPCESVESAGASTAYQKVDAMLGEHVVASRLQAAGLTDQQVHVRLSQLSERQLGQLAAQADLIHAGGMIQSDHVNDLGPLGCMFHELGVFLTNVYRVIFCWDVLK